MLRPERDDDKLPELLQDRQAKLDRLTLLADDYADGTLSKAEYVRQKTRITSAVEAIEVELASLQQSTVSVELAGARVAEAWEVNGLEWRRRLLGLLIKQIEVRPSPRGSIKRADFFEGKWPFDPQYVSIAWRA